MSGERLRNNRSSDLGLAKEGYPTKNTDASIIYLYNRQKSLRSVTTTKEHLFCQLAEILLNGLNVQLNRLDLH